METKTEFMTVEDVLGLRKKNMMFENAEYQRGKAWKAIQRQLLIDSVLRGYSIPSFHLHFIEDREGGIVAQRYEVIDGQQRLRALSAYREGSFKLLDPNDAQLPPGVLFTTEAKQQRCSWAGCFFEDLGEDDRNRFLKTKLIVVKVTEASDEAVRDLFIRQQGGTPLKPQEVRDAWPGGMTEVILRIGGKRGLDRCPGHEFFQRLARNPGRPEGRQMAAQMLLLLVARRDAKRYADISRSRIDQFYYDNLSIAEDDLHIKRFRKVLNTLVTSLAGRFTFKLVAHEAIALMFLVDEWHDEAVTGWQSELANAFLDFRDAFKEARKKKSMGDATDPYWWQYGVHTQTTSDKGATIRARYEFFRERMTDRVAPVWKDPTRIANETMRDVVFRRQSEQCAWCRQPMNAEEVELHHIKPHAQGGKTIPANLAAVHQHCHPRSKDDVQELQQRLMNARAGANANDRHGA